jgi:hypothetical protein
LFFSNFSKSKRAWQYRLIFQLFPLTYTYAWATSLWRSLIDFGSVQLKFSKKWNPLAKLCWLPKPVLRTGIQQRFKFLAFMLCLSTSFPEILATKKGHNKTIPFQEMKFLRIFWSKSLSPNLILWFHSGEKRLNRTPKRSNEKTKTKTLVFHQSVHMNCLKRASYSPLALYACNCQKVFTLYSTR